MYILIFKLFDYLFYPIFFKSLKPNPVMTQYLMKKERDFENLQRALDNYKAIRFHIRPFSLGHETLVINKNLENKILSFLNNEGLTFFVDNIEIIKLPLKNYSGGFKLEYRDKKDMRIYPYYTDPNDHNMPIPATSLFRHVLDDLLLEIDFEGKIRLELEEINKINQDYWKVVK